MFAKHYKNGKNLFYRTENGKSPVKKEEEVEPKEEVNNTSTAESVSEKSKQDDSVKENDEKKDAQAKSRSASPNKWVNIFFFL